MGSEKTGAAGQNGTSANGANGAPAAAKVGKTKYQGYGKVNGSGGLIGNYFAARKASSRPLPTEMGDGSYRQVAVRPGLRQDLRTLSLNDFKTLFDLVRTKAKGETQQDDKTMIMERTIQLVAGLPNSSKTQEILTNQLIGQLWNSLDHPPLLFFGDKYKYRQADGTNNNPHMPYLGATNQPYSRTVKPKVTRLGALPDPETVYESVMARDGFKKNANNVSSILWYWATIVIHDIFWTSMKDGNVNESSSYLDLAPLYGHSQKDVDSIRTFEGGKLKADTFADKRLIGNPPGVCIMIIMFNRFHNHVAENLAAINENNRFPKPAANLEGEQKDAAWKTYDEELFQTARLVTSGLYINIMLLDYVRNIINMNRVDSEWTLDPRQEMGTSVGTPAGAAAGVGNTVSAEFNLCYRWHSCISEMDEKWIQDFYVELLGPNYGSLDLQHMIMAVKKFEASIPDDPAERTFSHFKRGPDGKFDDDELVEALATAIEQPGGAFGGRNVPRIMKPVEMLGIIRGRKWNLAGLNEFRKHFGLKPYETFEDINSDQGIADSLRNLYQHPDHVELYPGIVAEEAKSPMVPGVGITPTYTISRVVLSDAVALVRGDRFYTVDYHPGHLTNWGYKEVEYNLDVNHGCVFYKLFLRAFPHHFNTDSVYAHYPMVIPSENKKILKNLKRDHLFTWDRPQRRAAHVKVTSYAGAQHVISNPDKYTADWQRLQSLVNAGSSNVVTPAGELPLHSEQRKALEQQAYSDGWKKDVKAFYAGVAERLIADKSYKLAGKHQLDVVRDFGNLAHVHFASRVFNLPLKSADNPRGVYSEQELYHLLTAIYVSTFHDLDPMRSFALRQNVKKASEQLGKLLESNVKLTAFGVGGLFTKKAPKGDKLPDYGSKLVKSLSKAGLSAYDITWTQVLPTAGALVPTQAQMFAQAIDYYLSPAGTAHLEQIQTIAAQPSSEANDALLLGYAMEGIRMAATSTLSRKATAADVITEDDGTKLSVNAGDDVLVAFASAARDPVHFPDPDKVDPKRAPGSYLHLAEGPHACLGREVSQAALVELFRAVFRRKGLRRVAGPQGELKKLPNEEGLFLYMTEDWSQLWPFPTSMKITWDE